MRTPAAESSLWICSGHMAQERLPWGNAREGDRLHADDAVLDAGERRLLERARLREVGAEMRAERFAPRGRGERDGAAHRHQALQVEPVVPGEVEGALGVRQRPGVERAVERVEVGL